MNCKPGDIARIVCPQPQLAELRDRIVRVTEPCDIAGEPGWVLAKRENFVMVGTGISTITDEKFGIGTPVYVDRLQDKYLRPIRGVDGEDEMLRIAGKPQQRDETLMPRKQMEHAR